METKGILIVCDKGRKGGGRRETKRQAILERRGKTARGIRETEKVT
jgi:hypothetical protein